MQNGKSNLTPMFVRLTLQKNMRSFLILTIVSTICFSAKSQSLSESNYKIFSVKENKEVKISDVINSMATADVLFYGEEHNDSVSHWLESEFLKGIATNFPGKTGLSMEMFERDVQDVMDEYLSGLIREKQFRKDARVWSNYKDYRPMIEYAKDNKIPVVCANAAGRYSNLAGRKGQAGLMSLPAASKKNFAPLPYDSASGAYYKKLQMMSGHSSTPDTSKKSMPVNMMGNFNLPMAQSLWDATMAYSISEFAKSHKGYKILQVNGRFHSDEHFAVVAQLNHYAPKLKVLVISSTSDDAFPNIKWEDYKSQGDYIIITDPKVPRSYEE